MGYATVDEFRADLVDRGEHELAELGDGELQDIIDDGERDALQVKQLRMLESVCKSLDRLSKSKTPVPVGSEASMLLVDTVNKGMQALLTTIQEISYRNTQIVEKSMAAVDDRIVKALSEARVPPTVNNTFDASGLEKVLKTFLGQALEKATRPIPQPKVVNLVEVPHVTVDLDSVAKSVALLASSVLDQKAPVVTVAGPRVDAPVIHIHVPKIKTATQVIERDGDGEVIGSTTTYEYQE